MVEVLHYPAGRVVGDFVKLCGYAGDDRFPPGTASLVYSLTRPGASKFTIVLDAMIESSPLVETRSGGDLHDAMIDEWWKLEGVMAHDAARRTDYGSMRVLDAVRRHLTPFVTDDDRA